MRIAVTGGSGKLGRRVVRRLHEEGHAVLNLDRAGERNPGLGLVPDALTFQKNMHSTFNIFQAVRRAGIKKIVYASSETVLGYAPEHS
jgi:nucleoside-diphosphate-sugar epimerase